MLFIVVCIIFGLFSYWVYEYRTLPYYEDKYFAPKGDFRNFIFWGLVCAVFYLVIIINYADHRSLLA